MKATADFIIRYRWVIIIAFIAAAIVFARQIPKAELDPDMLNYLPTDMPSRISKDNIEKIFGGQEMLMVLVKTEDVLKPETLQRVKRISRQMKRIKGIDKVLSLFELKNEYRKMLNRWKNCVRRLSTTISFTVV